MQYVVFDIDGVLLDPSARWQAALDSGDTSNYWKWHHLDKPILAGLATFLLWQSYAKAVPNFKILLITSRNEISRAGTVASLKEFTANRFDERKHLLLMRPDKVNPDHLLKLRTFQEHGFSFKDVVVVYEDNTKTVEAWRARGVTVYQTSIEGKNKGVLPEEEWPVEPAPISKEEE